MKKICMLLVLLSGVTFAVNLDIKDDTCKKQDIGGCESLFICQNNVSLIVQYDKNVNGCNEKIIIAKHIIDTKEQKVIEVPTKK